MSDSVRGKEDILSYFRGFEGICDEYLVEKAPPVPEGVKDLIVKLAPFVVMVHLAYMILHFLGFNVFYTPLLIYGGIVGQLSVALKVVLTVLEVLALPALLRQSRKGWRLMYYWTFVEAVSTFDVVQAIIILLVILYILFQVKSYYK